MIEHEVQDFPGLASRPFTWEESVEKFDRLVTGHADEGTCREIKDAVHSLENIHVADSDGVARPCERRYRRAAVHLCSA